MLSGADVFFSSNTWLNKVKGQRVGLLCHQASLMKDMSPVLFSLLSQPKIQVTAIFSPQHGFSGVKQANMITSADSSIKGIPLFSLYSKKTRRITKNMKKKFRYYDH